MIDPSMLSGGGPAAGPGGPPPGMGGGPGGPPSGVSSSPKGDSSDTLRHIVELFNQYMTEEEDDEDLAIASDLQAKTQKLLATQQKLADQAVGAGPGAKYMRKQGGGGSY